MSNFLILQGMAKKLGLHLLLATLHGRLHVSHTKFTLSIEEDK